MELSSLDLTLSRIKQIESRISQLDKKLCGFAEAENEGTKPFDKVLQEKIEEKGTTKDEDINKIIEKYSRENNIDKNLVEAVIKAESNYNKKAVSNAGAQGLMQLMPFTAETLGVKDPFDPEENISGGTKYLKSLINRYNSVELGLAAYNAGPDAVNKYGGVPPYAETQNYVKKVLEYQRNN